MVTTAGSASGTTATASAIPKITISQSGWPRTRPRTTISATTARAARARMWPTRSRFCCSGVRRLSTRCSRRAIAPNSVPIPVATTDRRSAAIADGRAGVDHVVAIAHGQIRVGEDMGGLLRRQRLSGQGRFLDLEVDGLDHPRVSGHPGARFEENDVARHQRARGDILLLAVAQHRGHRGGHSAQPLDRALGPVLLDEAQHHREEQDDGDDDGLQGVAHQRGEADCHEQDQDQDVLELRQQEAPRGGSAGGLELVRAVLGQAAGSLFPAQAALGRLESVEDRRHGERVPRRHWPGSRSRWSVGRAVEPRQSLVSQVVHALLLHSRCQRNARPRGAAPGRGRRPEPASSPRDRPRPAARCPYFPP